MKAPLQLRHLSASEASALTSLARGACELHLPSGAGPGGTNVAISLSALGERPQAIEAPDWLRLRIDWAGSRMFLDLPHDAILHWVNAGLRGSVPVDLPDPWRDAAYEHALDWIVAALSACGRGTARIVRLESPEPPGSPRGGDLHRFIVTLRFPDQSDAIHGVVSLDSLALLLVASLVDVPAPSLHPSTRASWRHLPVVLRLTLGDTVLPVGRLRALASGDVVFVTEPFFEPGPPLVLHLRTDPLSGVSLRCAVALDDLTLTLLDAPMATALTADTESLADVAEEGVLALDALPIRMSFDLGNTTLSLATLERMKPGETIALDRPIHEYVVIRANGAIIGTGHLVEIDGRIGVSIDSIRPPTLATRGESEAQ
jgi:type III secretion protein Q